MVDKTWPDPSRTSGGGGRVATRGPWVRPTPSWAAPEPPRAAGVRGAEWWRPERPVAGTPRPQSVAAPVSDAPVPFWTLMAYLFTLMIAPQSFFPALAPFRIALVTALAAVAAHLVHRLTRRQPVTIRSREMWVTVCLTGWAIATMPLSYWPGGSISFFGELYFKVLVTFWLLSNAVTTGRRIRQIVLALSLMAVPVAATGVDNYLTGTYLRVPGELVAGGLAPGELKRIAGYSSGLAGNPNDLALLLNLLLPLTWSLFLLSRRRAVRAALVGVMLLAAAGVIVTFSRAGFLALATIIAVYLWKLRKRPEAGWAIVAVVAVLASLPFLPAGYLGHLSTITDIEADTTGSAQLRWADQLSAVSFVIEHPIIGAGLGMNALALNEVRGPRWLLVHNVYLQYAVDLGIPGLVLFLFLMAGCLKAVMVVQQRSAGVPHLREVFYLAEGMQVSLVVFMIAGFFLPAAYHYYFYILAGLSLAVRTAYEAEARNLELGAVEPDQA